VAYEKEFCVIIGVSANTSDLAARDRVERRQVSVLFADMVGFTATVERLGEEKTLPFLRAVHERLNSAVREHGGSVRGFAGDGIMAVFGIPNSMEDDALRACRAACAIHAAFGNAADEFKALFGECPVMRTGISSGMVVIAAVEGRGSAQTAVGDVVNLASRLQSLAPTGGCLICDATRRLVEWLVEMSFEGEYEIKGKTKPQKLWRVISLHDDASRFDSSQAQGLTPYIGRDTELGAMRSALERAREEVCAIDIVSEPGLGKTRLVFEFLQGCKRDANLVVLTGHCVADGTQTPFLPFVEVVRHALMIQHEDETADIRGKIETGLVSSALYSTENFALLLNFMSIETPDAALAGLDGVLIGLRTRDLLRAILKSVSRTVEVILLIEDIQWIDRASEDFLETIIESGELSNLLVIHTRRPVYSPRWIGNSRLNTLQLQLFAAADIRLLAESRLGVGPLPELLIQEVTDRAGGNPLFGEEVLRFLIDKGSLRIGSGKVEFDVASGESELPASMQGLLTARTDALPSHDRALLEAAAVIGRRFDAGLLSLIIDPLDDIGEALRRLQSQDLIYREANSSDYVFKHVLLRDSIYQRLFQWQQSDLHLRIAQALEKRSEHRLGEVADSLAYHYGRTEQKSSTFTYLVMAGEKSLRVFSLNEAERYFSKALELYTIDSQCASEKEFGKFVASYSLCCNISLNLTTVIDLAERALPIFSRLGDNRYHILFLHHYIQSLTWAGKYFVALNTAKNLSAMAVRCDSPEFSAYALVSELMVSTYCAPKLIDDFRTKRLEVEAALVGIDDPNLTNLFFSICIYDELCRGRVAEALEGANRAIKFGISTNDPRALGYGLAMKALIAMTADDFQLALEMAEQAQSVSRAEFEKTIATTAKKSVLVPLNSPGAELEVRAWLTKCYERNWSLFVVGPECWLGVALATSGRIEDGINSIKTTIANREKEGFKAAADWSRLYLCEIYLAALSGQGKFSLGTLVRNILSLTAVRLFGPKQIKILISQVRSSQQFAPDGHYIARTELILGLLYKKKKKRVLALQHLTEARRIFKSAGPSAILTRTELALAEVSGG
jgi:class 3 adenylate cyclase